MARRVRGSKSGKVLPFTNEELQIELQQLPRVLRVLQASQVIQERTQKRKEELENDKAFLIATYALRRRLKEECERNPAAVRDFFKNHRVTSGFDLLRIRKSLRSIDDKQLRAVFQQYIGYVARFGVFFTTDQNGCLSSKWKMLPPKSSKFHAVVKAKLLQPPGPDPDDDEEADFEAKELDLPIPGLDSQIQTGKANFIHIRDWSGSSALTQIEDMAYLPAGLTFVLHEAEQPYLWCLIGEKVQNKNLKQATKIIRAFHRKFYRREAAGRRAEIKKLRVALHILTEEKGLLNDKTVIFCERMGIGVSDHPAFLAAQTYLSRQQKKINEYLGAVRPFRRSRS